jgi:hypothetical protein
MARSRREPESTGLSDNESYRQFCAQAASNDEVFNSFRRDPIYTRILEHVSRRQGAVYLEEIVQDADILASMPNFRRNDKYGGPRRYKYSGIGEASPTTLRYIKVLSDLKRYFGL